MFKNLNRYLSSLKVTKSKGVIGANNALLYRVVISSLQTRGTRGDILSYYSEESLVDSHTGDVALI